MDTSICNVIYVDRVVRQDRVVRRHLDSSPDGWESTSLQENVSLLLGIFGDVHLCASGTGCISRLFNLQDGSMVDLKPTIILIDTPHNEPIPEESSRSRSPSPHSSPPRDSSEEVQVYPEEDAYGLQLLQRIVSEAHLRNVSKLVVPIPVINFSDVVMPVAEAAAAATNAAVASLAQANDSSEAPSSHVALDRRLLKRCLDLGATDVMVSPMHVKSVTTLEVHAYRAHKDAAKDQQALLEFRRGRKRSWVGISDDRPFAYLREAMVSGLMKRICQMNGQPEDRVVENIRISVSAERKSRIAAAIGKWHFCAHDFSDDELVVASSLMFKHALAMPELAAWRIPTDQLTCFLIACRAAYNTFVPYHNFRHVVDVLQATFNFLVHIGALPAYPSSTAVPDAPSPPMAPMASLIQPCEALTLLITAIGHDVGHPGVNNGFLVVLNSPLAQLYNDRSVLESFHCAAYSQILRRYWPEAFMDTKMRSLMISSILATDMGLHFDYMKKLGDIQEKLQENNSTEGWNGRMMEEQRALACALLIKCADISNVARRHDTALQWMHILSDEFSRQASMETELAITSSLMAPPKKDMVSLSKAQLGFMNMFAIPLFQGVADIMPAMQYCVDELDVNKALFERGVAEQQAEQDPERKLQREGTFSPRTMSFAVTPSADKTPASSPAPPAAAPANAFSESIAGSEETAVAEPRLRGGESGAGVAFREFSPQVADPADKPAHIPAVNDKYKEVNGVSSQFDTVADFAASDPFNVNEGRQFASNKQRCSEATDGSASAPGAGDWASQATSATTGKMPLSPSTQGTSIISRDSMERPGSVPVTTITAPDSSKSQSEPRFEAQQPPHAHAHPVAAPAAPVEDASSLSSSGKSPDSKAVKKKSSRFLNIFRRNRGASANQVPSCPDRPAEEMVGSVRVPRSYP